MKLVAHLVSLDELHGLPSPSKFNRAGLVSVSVSESESG